MDRVAHIFRLGLKELLSLARDPVLIFLIIYSFTFSVYTPAKHAVMDVVNASIAIVDGVFHPAVTSVGIRPTIGDDKLTVETFLLDYAGDLYGRQMRLVFVSRLRDELKFDSLDELTAQMRKDAGEAARILAQCD